MSRKPLIGVYCLAILLVVLTLAAQCCAQRVYQYSLQPNQRQYNSTVEETQQRVIDGLNGLEKVCNVEFERVNKESQADIKFRWYTEAQLKGALGRLYDGNVVGLSYGRKRKVKWSTAQQGWLGPILAVHEAGHSTILRGAMTNGNRRGHSREDGSVMNAALNGVWFTPKDVLGLQRRLGKPKKPFWPREKSYVGKQVRALVAEWKELRALRDAETDPEKRKHLDKLTKAKHAQVVKKRAEWLKLKERWKNVPMAR